MDHPHLGIWVALALSPILIGGILGRFRKRLAVRISRWRVGASSYPFALRIAQAMLGDGPYAISPSWFPGGRATVK